MNNYIKVGCFILFLPLSVFAVSALDLEEAKASFKRDLQAKRNYDFTIGYRYGYDSNIALLPDNSATKQKDSYHALFAKYRWRKSLGQGWDVMWRSYVSASKYNDLSQFDQLWQAHSVDFGFSKKKWTFRFPITYTNTRYDNKSFAHSYQFRPNATRRLNNDLFIRLHYRYSDRNYELPNAVPEENYDGILQSAGMTLFWTIVPGKTNLESGFDIGQENTKGDNWDRKFYKIYSNFKYQMTPKLQLGVGFSYKKNNYDNIHSTLGVKKESSVKRSNISLTYYTNNDFEIQLKLARINTDANTNLYTYDRNLYTLSIAKNF